ncbi:MAG: hypothetical protein AAF798_16345 [Bacteroidota bacterium]
MKLFPLGRKASDLFVTLYILATLFGRFYIEPQLQGNMFVSLALGAFALLFLWAIVKTKLINPSYFGLIPTPEERQSEQARV